MGNPRFAREQALPDGLHVVPHGSDPADTGNDYAFHLLSDRKLYHAVFFAIGNEFQNDWYEFRGDLHHCLTVCRKSGFVFRNRFFLGLIFVMRNDCLNLLTVESRWVFVHIFVHSGLWRRRRLNAFKGFPSRLYAVRTKNRITCRIRDVNHLQISAITSPAQSNPALTTARPILNGISQNVLDFPLGPLRACKCAVRQNHHS